jgi:hypothetical protein
MLVIKRFFEGSLHVVNVNQNLSIALSTAFILHFFPRNIFLKSVETFSKMPAFIQAFMLFLFAILLKQVAVSDLVPFIYFQF